MVKKYKIMLHGYSQLYTLHKNRRYKKIIGFIKDELGGRRITEFAAFR